MGSLRTSALVGAFILLMPSAGAFAADMLGPPPSIPPPVEFGSGWYLRGDLGYKHYTTPDAHFDLAGYGDMINESISDTGLAGVGFGYKWNQNFRTDLTFDYEWPGHFHGNLPCPGPCTPGVDFSDEYANVSAWTGLLNGYVDLGTFSGITPYVGGGVGVSYLTTTNVHYLNPDASTGTWGGDSTLNFAWAVTAGASYDFGNNWALDVNYRYAHLGSAISAPTAPIFGNEAIHYDNINAHELRVGLRYAIQ